tara:strand:+ start:2067 stop:2477 length:411 start_codon:yes stop_codon:yes gene_type:complete
MKICIVIADYYKDISDELLKGSMIELRKNGYKNIKTHFVSGAFEIPNQISRNIKKFDAFIALGCVIKGETDHYNFISQAVTLGLMNLSIQSKKPIGFGILTCNNLKQAKLRSSILKKNKGKEVALGIISILKNDEI